jgi:acyl carrier protein
MIVGSRHCVRSPIVQLWCRCRTSTSAYIIFTSGRSGTPKGVQVSLGAIAGHLAVMQQIYRFTREDRISLAFDLTFDPSILNMLLTWNAGASWHVVPAPELFAPVKFIQNHALTVWNSTPTAIGPLTRQGALQPGTGLSASAIGPVRRGGHRVRRCGLLRSGTVRCPGGRGPAISVRRPRCTGARIYAAMVGAAAGQRRRASSVGAVAVRRHVCDGGRRRDTAMTEAEIYPVLTAIFHDIFGDGTIISPETVAGDVDGWDSFNMANLIVAVEKRFGFKVRNCQLPMPKSVGDFVTLIRLSGTDRDGAGNNASE